MINLNECVHGYSTHQIALLKYALKAEKGDLIIELGTGFYSTPLLDLIAESNDLVFKCYYNDKKWKEKVEKVVKNTEFVYVPNWEKWKLDENPYLTLLDSEELIINRFNQINKLVKKSKYIICHDADTYLKRGINLYDKYPNGELYNDLVPHTYVIDSNKLNENPKDISKVIKVTKKPLEVPKQLNEYAIVCCYSKGGIYDDHYEKYIETLYKGVKNNTTINVDFYCITSEPLNIVGVNVIKPKNDLKSWFIKGEIFNKPILNNYKSVLYLDIDIEITSNIDDIITSKYKLMFNEDLLVPNKLDTCVIKFHPSDLPNLSEEFFNSNEKTDASIITKYLKNNNIDFEFMQKKHDIGSYKADILGKNRFKEDFQIISFHGEPKPHQVGWNANNFYSRRGGSPRLIKRSDNKFNIIEKHFLNSDLFIIGGGPSLENVDLNKYLNNFNVLAINDGYLFDCSDVLYFGDASWYKVHKDFLINYNKPIYTTSAVKADNVINLLTVPQGLIRSRSSIAWNLNSGLAGINLALNMGANRIFLLGYDMKFVDGKSNWHENIRKVNDNSYKCFLNKQQAVISDHIRYFSDIDIFNVLIDGFESDLEIFPKVKFSEVLVEI